MNKKLDAQVAKAMGWHWDDDWECLIPPEQKAKPSEMWTGWHRDDDEDDLHREPVPGAAIPGIVYNGNFTKVILPEHSTDDAAMWQVVRCMRERGWYVAIDWDSRGCSVWISAESKFPAWVTGPEPAEAVCRAFLAAVEAQE